MSHNLDGLLNILQFLFGCRFMALQFLYVLSGSLISFRLPSLFSGLRRFVQNVEANAELDCVVTDKNVKITAGKKLSGTESFPVYVQKNHTV